MIMAILTLSGAVSIAFVEKTLEVSHVTFLGNSILDSGQLILLTVGIFSLTQSLVSATKSLKDCDFEPLPTLD